MKVKDILEVLQGGIPTVRIIDVNTPKDHKRNDAGVMICDYLDKLSFGMGIWKPFLDCEVKRFAIENELSHKRYKELGLMPPHRPDLTAEYTFSDLQLKVYHDIYIDGSTAGDGWKR